MSYTALIRHREFVIEGLSSLTPRERDVLMSLLTGNTNKQVGRSLKISPRTVEAHRSRIMLKTQTQNLLQLVSFAPEVLDESRSIQSLQ